MDAINEVLCQLQKEAKPAWLDISNNKRKFMRNIKNNNTTNNVILNEVSYEEVSCFKYVGSMVTYKNDVTAEIKERTASRNRFFQAFNSITKAKYTSKRFKIRT